MQSISLDSIQGLDLGDFLRQEPVNPSLVKNTVENEQIGDDESKPISDVHGDDEDALETAYQLKENVCQNPKCQSLDQLEQISCLHLYEINGDMIITICGDCYDQGFRMCLFSHEVVPFEDMTPVLSGQTDEDTVLYAQPKYHQNQLDPEILNQITDLDQYFQDIGLENPSPHHQVIYLD